MLTATACSSPPFFERSEAYELIIDTSESMLCVPGDDAWFYGQRADLVGPHFAISTLCHFEGTEVPESVAEQLPSLAELPATADGVELLVNQFALEPARSPEIEAGEVASWVTIGDERLELEGLPEPGSILAVTAPSDEDAVLWVEDEGRAQGLDLRTGKQVDGVPAYYGLVPAGVIQGDPFGYEDVRVLHGSEAWDLTCTSDFLEADRNIWREDLGWAADGTVFLQVTFNWCTYEDLLIWHLDEASALSVVIDEESLAPLTWSAAELPDTGGTLRYTVVFAIPDDEQNMTLRFTPVGDLENLAGDEDYAFLDTPESSERDLTF